MSKVLLPLLIALLVTLSACGGGSAPTPRVAILLEADLSQISPVERDTIISSVITIIQKRVDIYGVVDSSVQRQGENQVLIQIPDFTDIDSLKSVIEQTGFLEFRVVELNSSDRIVYLKDYLSDNVTDFFDASEKSPRLFVNNTGAVSYNGTFIAFLGKVDSVLKFTDASGNPIDHDTLRQYGDVASWIPARSDNGTLLNGDLLSDAQASLGGSLGTTPEVDIIWNDEGSVIFDQIAARLYDPQGGLGGYSLNHVLGIFVDNNLISAPKVNAYSFHGKATISGNFTIQSAQELANLLKAGCLPVPIRIVECYNVS